MCTFTAKRLPSICANGVTFPLIVKGPGGTFRGEPSNLNMESSYPVACFTGGERHVRARGSLLTPPGAARRWLAPSAQKWLCEFWCPLTSQACLPSPVGSLLLGDSHLRTPLGEVTGRRLGEPTCARQGLSLPPLVPSALCTAVLLPACWACPTQGLGLLVFQARKLVLPATTEECRTHMCYDLLVRTPCLSPRGRTLTKSSFQKNLSIGPHGPQAAAHIS